MSITHVHQDPQLDPVLSQINPAHALLSYLLKIHLNIILHLCLFLPSVHFPSGFPTITLHAHLFSPIFATCSTDLLDWITWIMETRKTNNNRQKGKTLKYYLMFAQCQSYMQQMRLPERFSSILDVNAEYLNIINSSLCIHKSTFMTGS